MTAPPCSAALPTMATMIAATKKSERPASSAKVSMVEVSISATTAVTAVATASTPSERLRDQAAMCAGSSEVWCSSLWRRSEYHVTPT